MTIEIFAQHVEISDTLRAHIMGHLHCALGRFGPRILHTMLHLTNCQAPYRTGDTQCQIVVTVSRLGQVTVEVIDSDLYTVIARALDRVEHTVAQELAPQCGDALGRPAISRIPAAALFRRRKRTRL